MSAAASLTALFALAPAMLGPLPVEQARSSLLLALCGGGQVEIALGGNLGDAPPLATTPCCAKGCRNNDKRRGIDAKQ